MLSTPHSGLKAPPIAALFVTTFDVRVGYTLTWKRTQPGIELDGQVEYKSLPSGLHKLEKDLIYFTHGEYTGLSAFQSSSAGDEERHARFVAVGVLVPLSTGKLGRAWMHAEGLRELASHVSQDGINEERLERAWEDYRLRNADQILTGARDGRQRDRSADSRTARGRAMSDATSAIFQDNLLDADHPALSMRSCIDTLGPLCFVVQRSALLRQRILISGEPPVQRLCDLVYALCVFSSITPGLNDTLGLSQALLRNGPLYNVGVHDISELVQYKSGKAGYLACTTDKILMTKGDLYDIRIELKKASAGEESPWPKIETAEGRPVKATQRDLRRYRLLSRELDRLRQPRSHRSDKGRADPTQVPNDTDPLIMATSEAVSQAQVQVMSIAEEDSVVEPVSWASMAYTSMLWWASSGQDNLAWEDEAIQDASLLEDLTGSDSRRGSQSGSPADFNRGRRQSGTSLSLARGRSISSRRRSLGPEAVEIERRDLQAEAMLLTAFFHRLTSVYLNPLQDLLYPYDRDSQCEDGSSMSGDPEDVSVSSDDIRTMGLDPWSFADRQFVVDVAQRLFLTPRKDGRKVDVIGGIGPVTVCGIKIC